MNSGLPRGQRHAPYLERNIARERKVNFVLILVKNGLERIQSEARIGI
jgi:hypothetical protein